VVYAIVKAGGRQEKVSVGDIVVMDRIGEQAGAEVELTPVLLVDGDKVTSAASDLAKVKVTAEVVRDERGPKITILKFKNKTGYRKRQGHRQELTRVKITGINN
jgi:large subunit ribosomal protein L21